MIMGSLCMYAGIVSACQPLFAFFLVLWLIIGCEVKKDGNRLAKCRLLPSLLLVATK